MALHVVAVMPKMIVTETSVMLLPAEHNSGGERRGGLVAPGRLTLVVIRVLT
jgi:hypothetical protein